eukprot:11609921-Heterocapsa_arctica.AAC.1
MRTGDGGTGPRVRIELVSLVQTIRILLLTIGHIFMSPIWLAHGMDRLIRELAVVKQPSGTGRRAD